MTPNTEPQGARLVAHLRSLLRTAERMDAEGFPYFSDDAEGDHANRDALLFLLMEYGTCEPDGNGGGTCETCEGYNVAGSLLNYLAAEYHGMEYQSMRWVWGGSRPVMAAGVNIAVPSEPTRPPRRYARDYSDTASQVARYDDLAGEVTVRKA